MLLTPKLVAVALLVTQPPPAVGTPPRLHSGSISNRDYPAAAIRAREEGDVVIRFTVTVEGRVTDCVPERSSGSAALDQRACAIWLARTRYTPATDAAGHPIAQSTTQFFAWRIRGRCPEGEPRGICITEPRPRPGLR